MSNAIVEPRPVVRYFCHRCSIEFEDVLQDYTCPYCAGGFIEQLEANPLGFGLSGNDFSDADMSTIDDMSNLDDSDEMHNMTPPMLNELAFLISGGRLRNTSRNGGSGETPTQPPDGAPRRHTFMEELLFTIGGGRPGTGGVVAGMPFLLVGAPGDYVFGGEGLDAVVTQLLGQLENTGPPPMPRERLAALVDEPVSEEQAAANVACSVCWDNFSLGETICRLECEHIFHSACIRPWLQLHATCPICRRSLMPDPPPAPAANTVTVTATATATTAASATATNTTCTTNATNTTNASDSPAAALNSLFSGTTIAAALPRILLRRIVHHPSYRPGQPPRDASSSSSSQGSINRDPSARGATHVWTPRNESTSTTNTSTSATSVMSDIELNYNMDLEMD